MKKSILLSIFLMLFTMGISFAVISSYDSITGNTVVNNAISLDIIGSSNDDNYTLSDVEQGETKWSPKIKIVDHADVSINVSLEVLILNNSAGNGNDVEISFWDEEKQNELEDIIQVPTSDLYFYVKHEFSQNAPTGNYYFVINVAPV